MKIIRLKVPSGVIVEFITISGLAELSGKSVVTLKKWEEKSWLPIRNFHVPTTENKNSEVIEGARLYSLKYAKLMAEEIKKVKQGVPVDNEVIRQLFIIKREERLEYSSREELINPPPLNS